MNTVEYNLGNATITAAQDGCSFMGKTDAGHTTADSDLDLMYVECRFCGSPVLWERGKTSVLLRSSGIDLSILDSECLILSEGCPLCQPGVSPLMLHVVRIATQHDLVLLMTNKGHA